MKCPLPRLLPCLLLFPFALFLRSTPAQRPAVPAALPQFVLPRDFIPTPQDLSVSSGLLRAIRDKFECKKCNGQEPGGRVGATMLKLGDLGQTALVTSYATDHCDDNGNCAIWLFPAQGEPQQLDWGASFVVVTTSAKPVPDIAVRGMTGERNEFVHLFRFVGGHYVATGCDALRDKNEMGDVVQSACR